MPELTNAEAAERYGINEGFLRTHPGIGEAVRTGTVEGVPVRIIPKVPYTVDWLHFRPGDTYIAERNTGLKLLTVKEVHPQGFIIPVEPAYPYDTGECVKIEIEG